ncbi:glycosyltransferase family 2 protein [Radiobacillus sp. PE A8.2]|uniref:glycosyltransferase family 2 protein n=1 Tax=Radiobacillus sp. PE A8.2 TaxID=3380349 RepID=UPI003890BF13
MKLLTIVIPCYNSQEYMRKCIDSLLLGGAKIEIIIVNDGSSDNTARIADEYANCHPHIVKIIHQKNGGHGDAINTGLRNASGFYFKVIDSDDWVEPEAYSKVLEKLLELTNSNKPVDMFISNYVYEKVGISKSTIMNYENILPENEIFTWDDVGSFRKGKYILMHSIIYRTKILRESNLVLPKHTFYVDNLFVYLPLPYVKKIFYLNVDFYRYYIGRQDQSVNELMMIDRIDQQIKVNKLMMELVDLSELDNKKLRKYMFNHLEITTVISSVFLIRSGMKENYKKKSELWKFIRKKDFILFWKLRISLLGLLTNIPGRVGKMVTVAAYKLSQKIVGFN